jgi:hypothetical protein
MSGKRGDLTSRAVSGLAGAGAAYGARKAITFAWRRITGNEPPTNPEDRQVSLRESVVWALLIGAGVNTAWMLATRVTSRPQPDEAD